MSHIAKQPTFTIPELSRRLNIDPKQIRSAVNQQLIETGRFRDVITWEAAVTFCIFIGKGTWRLMR